ncbi:MAG: OmpA family protein [Cellvibrionaceae bacterium]
MNTQLVRNISDRMKFGLVVTLVVLLSACASMPDETENLMTEAERHIEQARQTPAVAQYASRELQQAESSLSQAKSLWDEKGRDEKQAVEHHAYLARQQAATALQLAALGEARAEIEQVSEQRNQVLMQAREREVDVARERADQAETRAEATEQRYRTEQRQARQRSDDESQRQLEELRQTVESLQAQQTERGMVLTMEQVLFDFGEAELNPGGERALGQLARFLEQNPDRQVLVEGYTDNIGDENFNRDLSQRRADSVRSQLLARGISENRVETRGHGENYPVATNETIAGRQMNRRVEVVVGYQGQDTPQPRNESPQAETNGQPADPQESESPGPETN